MTQKTKIYLLVGAMIVLFLASMVVPAAPFKAVSGAVLFFMFYYLSRQMRTASRAPREKEVINLSEDEVQYKTREKKEPAGSRTSANKTGKTDETSRTGNASQTDKAGSKTASGIVEVQADVIEVTNEPKVKRKPSPYKI